MSTGSARIAPMLPSTRLAAQAAASALAAIGIVNFVALDRPYWVILTAIVVMVGSAGETLAKSIDRTVGTLFGLIAGLAIYWIAFVIGFPAFALLVITAPSVVFFKFANYRVMVTAITASVVLLLELGGATQTLVLARLLDTVIGATIAVAVSFLILRLPTRRPVMETIDTYCSALETMVHDSLQAVIDGHWSAEIDGRANQLRGSDADFERLAEALRAESALIGGGDIARAALAVLPVLRGHVDTIIEASHSAAGIGFGQEVADELRQVDRQIGDNLNAVRDALESGVAQDVPVLDPYYGSIEQRLMSRLKESDQGRRDVVTMLNLLLALRRLNRGLRHVMASLKAA